MIQALAALGGEAQDLQLGLDLAGETEIALDLLEADARCNPLSHLVLDLDERVFMGRRVLAAGPDATWP